MNEENNEEIDFHRELSSLLNRFSKENDSDTPDFILAEYLRGCLELYNKAVNQKKEWSSE